MAKVGRYELVRKLATGGMAEVFLAKAEWARGVERIVVVKRILAHLIEEPSFVEMFLSEAKLASLLSHPNIVQIFEFGEDQGGCYLAMEYVDGSTLRALATRAIEAGKPIPFPVCAKIISSACEALVYAHELTDPESGVPLQIVHRDISPDNILISRHGTVKVVDFGIAKAITQSHRTTTGIVKGKVAYMAPEQLRSTKFIDRRADVYALGVVLYELVSGTKPYDADSEITMAHAVLYEPVIPIRQRRQDVPEELEKIITKTLERERDERYADCREMHTDLERYIMETSREPLGVFQIAQMVVDLKVAPVGPQVTPPPGLATPNRVASAEHTPPPVSAEVTHPVVERPTEPERLARTGTDGSGEGRSAGASVQALLLSAEPTRVERPSLESTPSFRPAAPASAPAPMPASDQKPVAEMPAQDCKEQRPPLKASVPPSEASGRKRRWRRRLVATGGALLISGVAFVSGRYGSQPQATKTVDAAQQEQVKQEQAKKDGEAMKAAEEAKRAGAEDAKKAEEVKKAAEEAKRAAQKAKKTEEARLAADEEARKVAEAAKRLADARKEAEQAELLAKPISLTVESKMRGANIRLTQSDKVVAERASPVEVTVLSGTVKVEVLDQFGRVCRTKEIELKPGSDPMRQTIAAVSMLNIRSFPWSRVKVDGNVVGKTPVDVMVCEGTSTITLVCSNGGNEDVQQVKAEAGQIQAVNGKCM